MKTTISTSLIFLAVQAFACSSPIATTSFYYTPDAKAICGKYYSKTERPCSKFTTDSNMQGSGIMMPGLLYRYKAKPLELSDGCKTTFGYSGRCLIPYVSIAADPRYHHMGDYIRMPALKGKSVKMADGRVFKHPGYLRVDDTGSAIKNRGRFDFYTGSLGLKNANNAFSDSSDSGMSMENKKVCSDRKTYENVKTSVEKSQAKALVDAFEKAFNSGFKPAAKVATPASKKVNKRTGGGQN